MEGIVFKADNIDYQQIKKYRRKKWRFLVILNVFTLLMWIGSFSVGNVDLRELRDLVRLLIEPYLLFWTVFPRMRSRKIVYKIEIRKLYLKVFYRVGKKEDFDVLYYSDFYYYPRNYEDPKSIFLILSSKSNRVKQYFLDQNHGFGWDSYKLYSIYKVICDLGINDWYYTLYVNPKIREQLKNDSALNEAIERLKAQ